MLTAEIRNPSQPPSVHVFAPAPVLFASAWVKAGIWLLAVASLGASLASMDSQERPASAAYALDRDWAANSPLGALRIEPAPEAMPPLAVPMPVCAVCGRVESVLPMPPLPLAGRKTVFEVRVRMEDGQIRTVHLEKRLALGTLVTLEHGVLRVANA